MLWKVVHDSNVSYAFRRAEKEMLINPKSQYLPSVQRSQQQKQGEPSSHLNPSIH
jgi:hypothetical protein